MHIVVLVKQVPASSNVRMDPQTGTMVREGTEAVTNPLDEHALYEAARIKEEVPGCRITALTMGPPTAVKVLREAMARGADNGYLLSHRAFAGADTLATARTLAAAVLRLWPIDLIIAGERTTDGETGQTGPMTASLLAIPCVTYVRRLQLVEKGKLIAERMVEDGTETVEVSLPVLVTVVKDINVPVAPSLRQVIKSQKMNFPVWGLAELGLKEDETGLKGSPTRVVKIFSPKFARATTRLHWPEDEEQAVNAVFAVMAGAGARVPKE